MLKAILHLLGDYMGILVEEGSDLLYRDLFAGPDMRRFTA